MNKAKTGDRIKVHYIGIKEDGSEFDNTYEKEPLEIILGGGMSIRGFEMGIVGMVVGEIREFEITRELGFGARKDEYIEKVNKNDMPSNIKLEIGTLLQVPHIDGSSILAKIIEVDDECVTLDLNHPLAGEKITFKVELLEIVSSDTP